MIMLAGVLPSPSVAAPDLSGFLGGFETGCSGPETFVRYMFSLGDKYTTSGDLSRQVLIPPGFESAIGKETVTDKGEYMAVSVPLRGTYLGLPVSRPEFELGNENGSYTVALVFDAPVRTVKSLLGATVAGTNKILPSKFPNSVPSIEILNEKGRGKVLCILSD